MILTFCGHAEIIGHEQLTAELEKAITDFLTQTDEKQISFYCGGYGDFDRIASRAVDQIKKDFPDRNVEKIYVTPYLNVNPRQLPEICKQYDDIIYPPIENAPLKFAVSKRNEWMVDQSDAVFAYVRRDWGGAEKTLSYAKRKKKRIIAV